MKVTASSCRAFLCAFFSGFSPCSASSSRHSVLFARHPFLFIFSFPFTSLFFPPSVLSDKPGDLKTACVSVGGRGEGCARLQGDEKKSAHVWNSLMRVIVVGDIVMRSYDIRRCCYFKAFFAFVFIVTMIMIVNEFLRS